MTYLSFYDELSHIRVASQIKRCNLSTGSKYTFFQHVDQLPEANPWIYDELTITGDVIGEDGKPLSEQLDLWRCDPVECIRELIEKQAL